MNHPQPCDALGTVLFETEMPEEFVWTVSAENLIPRPWLAGIIDAFTREPGGSGILLLIGESGTGKTAFCRERLAALGGQHPVAHFISDEHPQWDNPPKFLDSLTAQLRRKHRLGPPDPPPPLGWHPDHPVAAQKFLAVLRDVSRYLQHSTTGAREIIWLDALNTAYGKSSDADTPDGERAPYSSATGALHELIEAATIAGQKKLVLPPGIYLIVTSSNEPCLSHLRPHCDKIVDFNDKDKPQIRRNIAEDIKEFFKKRNLDDTRMNSAIEAVKRNFLFARFWADIIPECDPDRQPRDLDELLELVLIRTARHWQSFPRAADSLGDLEIEVLDNFGLLACTLEPLSYFLLTTLFEEQRADRLRTLCDVANFSHLFRLSNAAIAEDTRLRFFHGYIVEFLLKRDGDLRDGSTLGELRRRLTEKLRAEGRLRRDDLVHTWHAELATACNRGKEEFLGARLRGAPLPDGRVTAYAMRHLCSHLRMAEEWDRLAGELTDAGFLVAKVEASRGGIFDLLHTLQSVLRGSPKMPADHPRRAAVNAVLQALGPHAEPIAEDSFIALQLIRNETPEAGKTPLTEPANVDPDRPLELRDQPWYIELCAVMDGSKRAWLETRCPTVQAGCRPERVLRHRNSVLALAFAPGPGIQMLASVGADHRLRVWKDDGQPPVRFKLPGADRVRAATASGFGRRPATTFPPTGLAFVRGRQRIATATEHGILLIDPWLDEAAVADDFGLPSRVVGRVHSLAASSIHAHPLVLVGDKDGSGRVLDLDHHRVVATLKPAYPEPHKKDHRAEAEPSDNYCCVALSPDGTLAAVAHPDHTISVWELDIADYLARIERRRASWGAGRRVEESWPTLTVRCRHHLPAPVDRRVDSLAFSPCGKILAVGGGFQRGIVELWRLDRADCLCVPAHRNAVWALAFAVDPTPGLTQRDTLLITGSFDRTAGVWKLGNITLAEERAAGRTHTRSLPGAGRDQVSYTIRELPDPLVPTVRMAHRDVVVAVAVSPDNHWLATGGEDDAVHRWNLCALLEQAPSVEPVGGRPHAGFLHAGAFDPQGRWLATGGEDGIVQLWELESGKPAGTSDLGGLAIRSLRFSADGQRLAIGTAGSSALCHLNPDGSVRARETIPAPHAIYATAFAPEPDGSSYFTGDERGGLIRHGGGRPVPPSHRHIAAVRALGFSPDGRWLVSVGDDSNLIVTDLIAESAATRPPSREHLGRIKSVAFSADGRWLATGGHETIRLWDTSTWTVFATLRGHRDEIWALDFSPDGRFLASGSRDSTARVWNLATCKRLCCLPCSNAVIAVQFGSDSGELRVADAGPGGGIPSIHIATIRGVPAAGPIAPGLIAP